MPKAEAVTTAKPATRAKPRAKVKALAYYRTSSATSLDGDTRERQRLAVMAYAKAAGVELVGEYYDAAVNGSDPIDQRPAFVELLTHIRSNGVRTIIVESPDRFARDLVVQLAGHDMLRKEGITLIAASAPDFFLEDTPTARLVRSLLGAVAEFEKASLLARLAGARRRMKTATGRCEGRKPLAELHPEAAALARRLRRKPKGGKRSSLRDVAAQLAAEGFVNERGEPWHPGSIAAMIDRAPAPGRVEG